MTNDTGTTVSGNRAVMIVLSYLWILALVPLLVEKQDTEVQWHAKHGIVLMVAEIAFWIAYNIIMVMPGLGCVFALLGFFVWLAIVALHLVCIIKGLQGGRLLVPGISQYASRF